MTETVAKNGLRTLAIVTSVMLVALALCFGAGALVVYRFSESIDGNWSSAPVSSAKARDLFGIEVLPKVVLQTQQREGGFQDSFYDALVQVPLGSGEAFLEDNHLARDPEALGSFPGAVDQFEQRIRDLAAPKGELRVVPLTGVREAHLADGGSVVEYRNVLLLEFDDQLWVALVAFDT